MDNLYDALPVLAQYNLAFMILAALCLATITQSLLCVPLAFATKEQSPGMPLRLDYRALSFRAMRTYQNFVETLPAFGFALLTAIIVGVIPFWVNLLAGIYFVFRLLFWAIYYSGIGKTVSGPRSIVYAGANLANVTLAGMMILAAVQYSI